MSLAYISKSALAGFLAICGTTVHACGSTHANGSAALSNDTQPAGYGGSDGMIAASYFTGYHAERPKKEFTVAQMQWSKYTHVKYAFAETNADGTLNLTKSAPDQLPKFVEAAHKNNVKAMVAIGGWTGSIHFSTMVNSAENRTAFVKKCLDMVAKYDLDGLDFDWEYPAKQGLGCNAISANDTSNFITFLQELRKKQTKPLLLTAAVSLYPYNDASGEQSANGALKPLADVLDYAVVMGYDVFGAWAPTGGPNAPLQQSCDTKHNNQGGIKEGVAAWIGAGFPSKKIVLGIGAYGHGFSVNSTNAFAADGSLNAYPVQNSTHREQGGIWDDDPAIDECGNANPPSGTYTFDAMITEAHFLDKNGKPAAGIASGYNNCSQTPFLYDKAKNVWVSYDNPQSLAVKGNYIKSSKLGGFAVWEAGGDYNNIIANSIRTAVGLKA